MAGHSKWANIKHRKDAQDKKKGKVFSRLIREITIAARIGGEDISTNPRLRLAVDKALSQNMTKDTIERAIKRGAGGIEGQNVEEITYEGYGPGGVAVLVECMTDNRVRTVSEVRHAFTKCGGNLGTTGSVAYLFKEQGEISFAKSTSEDKIMEAALDAGAEDVVANDDGTIDVITKASDFAEIKEKLLQAGLKPERDEINKTAAINVSLDKETAEKMLRLLDMLEELDDVQEVYSNADISTDILNSL